MCRNCLNKNAQYSLALILSLFFGFLLVVVVVSLNIRASPIFDSLLFFTQAVYLILAGRNDYEIFNFLAIFHPNFTLNLCITPSLDAFTRLFLLFLTPVYILFLLLLTLVLTRIQRFSHHFGRHSILHGLWFLFLISYFNIASISFETISCRKIGYGEGESSPRFVLVQDASVTCLKGLHLLFSIFVVILLVLFILPLPIYTLIIMRIPRLKPIADVFCSFYRDNRRWWISISLIRRLLLVLVAVFIDDIVQRHLLLLISIAVILLCQVATMPYKKIMDNSIAIFVTWMLLMTAVVTQPSLYLSVDPYRISSLFLVIFTILVMLILLVPEIIILLLEKKSVNKFYKSKIQPKVKHYRMKLVRCWKKESSLSGDKHELEPPASSNVPKIVTLQSTTSLDVASYREPLLDNSADDIEGSLVNGMKKDISSSILLLPKTNTSPNPNPTTFVSSTEVAIGDSYDSGVATSSTNNST